jgi:hypothetical protein
VSNLAVEQDLCRRTIAVDVRSRGTFGRRLRAALVLADQTAAGLAAQVSDVDDLNIGLRTIERIMQGDRVARRPEVLRFAEVLGVPAWFLEQGFDGDESQLQLRLSTADELEAELQRFRTLVDELEDELGRVRQAGARRGGRG